MQTLASSSGRSIRRGGGLSRSGSSSSFSSSAPLIAPPRLHHCRRRAAAGVSVTAMAAPAGGPKPPVLVSSCTGNMGRAVAEAAARAGLPILPYTLCAAADAGGEVAVAGTQMRLVGPDGRDALLERLKQEHPGFIAVDYTVPDVIMDMAALYARHKVPFVMGTTGGDRQKLVADTEAAGVYAVIAPQMGKQVVAFQAAMELMAERFPGAFGGYALEVVESHQSGKKDTSGTAKAVVASLEKLGAPLGPGGIEMVRERGAQTGRMGVPEEHLSGHAFHTYRLTSPDGTVGFEFQHNVCGRTIYAEGTVDAVLFLAAQVRAGASKRVYNMIDVLRAGAMR